MWEFIFCQILALFYWNVEALDCLKSSFNFKYLSLLIICPCSQCLKYNLSEKHSVWMESHVISFYQESKVTLLFSFFFFPSSLPACLPPSLPPSLFSFLFSYFLSVSGGLLDTSRVLHQWWGSRLSVKFNVPISSLLFLSWDSIPSDLQHSYLVIFKNTKYH